MKIQHFLKHHSRFIDVSKIINIESSRTLFLKKHRIEITYDEHEVDFKMRFGFGTGFVVVPCLSVNEITVFKMDFDEEEEMQQEMDDILVTMQIYKLENERFQKQMQEKYKDKYDELLSQAKMSQPIKQ